MAIFRINKTNNYTVMSNRHFYEKEMSLKAKGLLSLMFSLPDDWDYSIGGLVAICKENESAVKSALNELKQFGYLKVTKEMPNNENGGRITYIYDVFELPIQESKKQGLENLPLEFQQVENQGQLNINNKNTNELNIKKIKEEWNALPSSIPKIQCISGSREKQLLARLKEHEAEKVIETIKSIKQSSFLQGHNEKNWTITFDWFIKPTNFQKVLEGNYNDKSKQGKMKREPNFDINELYQKAIQTNEYDI